MQIHELSTFSGTPTDSDYLAIDNGTQTAKIAVPSLADAFIDTFIDLFYPVGSYYDTSDTSFNPNTAWGGTWVQDSKGKVLVAQDSTQTEFQTVGQEGGEKTHTLTISEMPAHTHGSKALSGTLRAYQYNNWSTSTTGIVSQSANANNNTSPTTGTGQGGATFTVNATHEHNSVGDGDEHNNLQPYTVVVRWHRIA